MRTTCSTRRSCPACEPLEGRRLLNGAIDLDSIRNAVIPAGKTTQIPISVSAYGNVVYSVQSSNPAIVTQLSSTGPTVKFTVGGYGTMTFKLLPEVAPNAVRRFADLAASGYYNGLPLFKISRTPTGSLLQGGRLGAPAAVSSYADEFDPAAVFSGDGQLAVLNTRGKDSAGNAFFITRGSQRPLDHNYTIFGQLVRGSGTRDAIANAATKSNGSPITPIVISKIEVLQTTSDAVIAVRSAGVAGGTVTVTANSGGESDSRTFNVNAVADGYNDPPILTAPANTTTAKNRAVTLTAGAFDAEGDAVTYAAVLTDSTGAHPNLNARASVTLVGNKITVTPRDNYAGPLYVLVGVAQKGATSRGSVTDSPYDVQVVTVAVGDKPISATGVGVTSLAGAPLAGVTVARFTCSDSSLRADHFAAQIDWGDGTIGQGRIADDGAGGFAVLGDLGSAGFADRHITVNITGDKGATATAESRFDTQNFASVLDRLLVVNATDAGEAIALTNNAGIVTASIGGASETFTRAAFDRIAVYAGGGNDVVTIGTGLPGAYVDAGAGNDRVIGGDGDDNLVGGAGKNTLAGGLGDDRLAGSGAPDQLFGGAGNDRLYGGAGDDLLDGGSNVDRLYGGIGNDSLFGGASSDKLYGEAGDDSLDGGDGADYLTDRDGRNIIRYDIADYVSSR